MALDTRMDLEERRAFDVLQVFFCHESEKERKWSWVGGEEGRSLEKLRKEKPELGFSRDYR